MDGYFGQVININAEQFKTEFLQFKESIGKAIEMDGLRLKLDTEEGVLWLLPIYLNSKNTVVFAIEIGSRELNTKIKENEMFFVLNTGDSADGQNYYEYVAFRAQGLSPNILIGGKKNVRTPV